MCLRLHFFSRFSLSAMPPPSTFQISLQTWFTNSLACEITLKRIPEAKTFDI